MRAGLLGLLALLGNRPGLAQTGDLAHVAADARLAVLEHGVDRLLATSSQVLIQLPGTNPSAAVGRSQAAALLRDYFGRFEEVGVDIRSTRDADGQGGVGYVELGRRYRVPGTQEVRSQTLLLGYQQRGTNWVLIELRISG